MTISNAVTELDASGNYASEADYQKDLNDPRIHFDGAWRAAVGRKAVRSRMPVAAPVKTPLKSWSANPGRFPNNDDNNTTTKEGNQ
jgi:hypothetical protein